MFVLGALLRRKVSGNRGAGWAHSPDCREPEAAGPDMEKLNGRTPTHSRLSDLDANYANYA